MSKLYVLNYQEVQIAGYRILTSYDEALKEYLKHCILETRSLLAEDDDCGEEAEEEIGSDSESGSVSESEQQSQGDDELSCIFEIQELQDKEYITTKEYDYECFQSLLEDKDDIPAFLDDLEKAIDADQIPEDIKSLFSE